MSGLVGDALLNMLVRRAPTPVARWAARKAAQRGMHWVALPAGGEDPCVLSLLGLYDRARAAPAADRRAAFGQTLAKAALGEDIGEADAARLTRRERTRLASALALSAPRKAAGLLPENAVAAVAACYIAAGRIDEADSLLGSKDDRETALLRAHIALSRGQYEAGRRAWNAAFSADGLAEPLSARPAPVAIGQFGSAAADRADGPTISVIVPFRDAEATLEHAIGSLLRQSWRNLEILAVDDASRDASAEIARRLAARDPRIRCLENARNPGVYGARNTALEAASGDYVTFLDADDWSPAERFARQMAAIRDGAAVSIANHVRIDGQGRPVAPRVFPLARPVPITMLLRRAHLAQVGLFEEVETGADSEMFGRLQMRYGRRAVARDPALLLVARWREGSLSAAREGGMLGRRRLAYRADWMFRHAGLEPGPASVQDERRSLRRQDD